MKYTALFLLAASVVFAQTQSNPPAPAGTKTKPAAQAAKPGTTVAKPGTATAAKKPASEMPVIHALKKPLFTEQYADIKIGTGALAEPSKLYHVQYTGYLAATGQKFDSSYDHKMPVMKDGKPVMGADGKPELGEAQPLIFPQGAGRLIPGFDQGFTGMHIGGKRRIFIPWQLAYGMRDIPSREGHPGIPPRSDLIFDVELLDVTDMPALPQRPMGAMPARPATPPAPGAPARPAAPSAPATPAAPPTGAAPSAPPAASAPATPPATHSDPNSQQK